MGPFRRTNENTAPSEPAVRTAAAASCEYRHLGDDRALLTIGIPLTESVTVAAMSLRTPAGAEVAPTALTLQPDAGLARAVFVVDRSIALNGGASLEVVVGADLSFSVPEPVQRPAVGAGDADLASAVGSTLTGEELTGVLTMFEKRASIAERAADDLRQAPPEARKLAQAYREIWEVRELLESREEVHGRSGAAVEAAEAARTETEAKIAEARAELDAVRAESARTAAELAESRAAAEAAATEAAGARDELAAAAAEGDELASERDEALAAVDHLRNELVESRDAVEAWTVQAERAGTQLAEAVARAELLEGERDEALEMATNFESELQEARASVTAIQRDLAEACSNIEAWTVELEAARTGLADQTERADALERDRDEAQAAVQRLEDELAKSRSAVADAVHGLDGERTLYEARLASGLESERNLRREVDELQARLGEKRKARNGMLRKQPETITKSFSDAQRERLRQTSIEEQRAQVAALEQQLERIKQRSAATG